MQATAAHTAEQPEPGDPEHRAAQGQGKNFLQVITRVIIWTVTPERISSITVLNAWFGYLRAKHLVQDILLIFCSSLMDTVRICFKT